MPNKTIMMKRRRSEKVLIREIKVMDFIQADMIA